MQNSVNPTLSFWRVYPELLRLGCLSIFFLCGLSSLT